MVFSYATTLPMNRTRNLTELAWDLVLASTQLWYLYALALYFVLVKLLLRFDLRWVLGTAAAVSALTSWAGIEAANRESLLQHFVYFAVGALAPSLPRLAAEHRGRHVTAWLLAGTCLAGGAAALLGLPASLATLVVGVTGVPLAVRLVAAASGTRWFGTPAAALGKRTLPVYVLHVPLLSLLHHVVVPVREGAGTLPAAAGPDVVGLLGWLAYPALATAAVTAACLGLHALLVRAGLGFLFQLPDARRATRRTAPRTVTHA